MEQQELTPQASKRPLIALLLSFLPALCCALPYLIALPFESDLFIYYRNLPMILVGETILCLGALGALGGVILGGLSLSKKDPGKALSILAFPVGLIALLLTGVVMFLLAGMSVLSQ